MKKLIGHWFCLHCDDVVFMPEPPFVPNLATECPVCRKRFAFWVEAEELKQAAPILRIISPDYAAAMFETMREAVLKAGAK
jgi:hypothetical protein